MPGDVGLWWRWTWRDLRSRWVQVVAIAFIIAIGAGVYAGLSSSTEWRRASYDASYEALGSHHLTATTVEGSFAQTGQLRRVLESMDRPEWIERAEERLVMPTQVDARAVTDETVLVPGRIVGVEVADGGPRVDRIEMVGGRALAPADAADAADDVVVLDSHFVDVHDLPATGSIDVGGRSVDYVGNGYSPEYFIVASGEGSFLAEAGFAVMFTALETAQRLSGAEDQVNQLAIRLAPGVDPAVAADQVEAAFAATDDAVAVEVVPLEEERLYRRLYDDIDSDQRLFNIFAVLILAGAAFAAFNLTNRIVEAQRREIGVGMALGLGRTALAVRPMAMGAQIAALGVVAGVGFGLWVGALMSDLNLSFVPLPEWRDEFQPWVFARASVLSLALILAATILPVRRAVRVDPVEAINTRPGRSRGGGLVPHLRRISLPGSSIRALPIRNVARSARRTLLTVFGIATAIAVLVALTGMIDSIGRTIDVGEAEILGATPERTTVTLDFFYPDDGPEVNAVADSPGVASAEPELVVGGALLDGDGEEIEVLLSLIDLQSDSWAPTAVEGRLDVEGPAVVLAEKAADDLGVAVGDTVTLRHPRREGFDYSFVESEVTVGAIHPNPYRFVTYMDRADASLMGLEGIVNVVSVVPEDGTTTDDLKETLFGQAGVASVEGVNDVAETLREALEDMLGFLTVIQGFVLVMALLIAFNSTSIASDERRREHATMFAFGLPVRSVLGLVVAESLIIGVLGTVTGIVVGRLLLAWMVNVLLPESVPDLGILVDVAGSTYLTAAALGVVAVAIAPLLTVRRLRRMDIPATLRVVE